MSNIQDITSLSDLISTSPNQPASESLQHDGLPETSRLNLAASVLVRKTTETIQEETQDDIDETSHNEAFLQTSTSQDYHVERRHDKDTADNDGTPDSDTSESDSQSQNSTSLPSHLTPFAQLSDVEILLEKQSLKLSLQSDLNDTLKKRTDLKASVEDLRAKVKYLKDQKRRRDNKRTLEALLKQNESDFVARTETNSNENTNQQAALNNEDDDDAILKSLNVLPSSNWTERLEMIRKFMPFLELDKIRTNNYYNGNNELIRTIEFVLISPLLFKIQFKLLIDTQTEALKEIVVGDAVLSRKSSPSLTTLSILSPSFTHVLMKNYLPKRKINLIMFGLNSLSVLLHRRVSILYKLLRMYPTLVRDGDKYSDFLETEEIQDNIRLFAVLKPIESLEFAVKRGADKFIIRLSWIIEVQNKVTADFCSNLKLQIYSGEDESEDKVGVFRDCNSLFVKLSKEYGIVSAFGLILKNVFGIIPPSVVLAG
ncbi:uncharacterized protein RJT20DRAFT_125494 [Scheffersomyces xylosifermentans]|uniref:uncharacterized protein n=1 Tax=Scheffersomyces xylosifermentans TaxID=1304137 RepID=UPI00315D1342